MKKKIKIFFISVLLMIIALFAYVLLFGKLFPYSPLIIGFAKHELANVIIYIQNGTEYDDLKNIDSLIPIVQNFHELRFLRKPEIFRTVN